MMSLIKATRQSHYFNKHLPFQASKSPLHSHSGLTKAMIESRLFRYLSPCLPVTALLAMVGVVTRHLLVSQEVPSHPKWFLAILPRKSVPFCPRSQRDDFENTWASWTLQASQCWHPKMSYCGPQHQDYWVEAFAVVVVSWVGRWCRDANMGAIHSFCTLQEPPPVTESPDYFSDFCSWSHF